MVAFDYSLQMDIGKFPISSNPCPHDFRSDVYLLVMIKTIIIICNGVRRGGGGKTEINRARLIFDRYMLFVINPNTTASDQRESEVRYSAILYLCKICVTGIHLGDRWYNPALQQCYDN